MRCGSESFKASDSKGVLHESKPAFQSECFKGRAPFLTTDAHATSNAQPSNSPLLHNPLSSLSPRLHLDSWLTHVFLCAQKKPGARPADNSWEHLGASTRSRLTHLFSMVLGALAEAAQARPPDTHRISISTAWARQQKQATPRLTPTASAKNSCTLFKCYIITFKQSKRNFVGPAAKVSRGMCFQNGVWGGGYMCVIHVCHMNVLSEWRKKVQSLPIACYYPIFRQKKEQKYLQNYFGKNKK